MIEFEEPVVTAEKNNLHDSVETHPSYAQIGASRVSGHACLYGSDFRHQHYVIIRIKQNELHRGLSNDWPHSGEEYIEVALSEAQWATFVSAMNMGDGVQCTLLRLNRKCIPKIPEPPVRKNILDYLSSFLFVISSTHANLLVKWFEPIQPSSN